MIGRYKLGDRLPGPGDPETWPAYSGHPNDPRGDDPPEFGIDQCECEGDGCELCLCDEDDVQNAADEHYAMLELLNELDERGR